MDLQELLKIIGELHVQLRIAQIRIAELENKLKEKDKKEGKS